jgi:HAD superfamily hydrolase (TIGR01509 family)
MACFSFTFLIHTFRTGQLRILEKRKSGKGETRMDQGIIWDLDGVIVDSAPFHFEAWREFVAARGKVFTHDAFTRTFGMKNEDIFASIFGDTLGRDILESWSGEKEWRFRQLIRGNVRPFPGALHLMRSLNAAGHEQAIASSTPLENIHLILNGLTIHGLFDVIISGETVTRGKPDPEAFLKAAEGMALLPYRCLVIEDAPAGISAAKRAEMKAIGVTNTVPGEKLSSADLVVGSLEEVDLKTIAALFR